MKIRSVIVRVETFSRKVFTQYSYYYYENCFRISAQEY